jgi:hypothetical protein
VRGAWPTLQGPLQKRGGQSDLPLFYIYSNGKRFEFPAGATPQRSTLPRNIHRSQSQEKEPAIVSDPSSLNAGVSPGLTDTREENAYQLEAIYDCTMAGLTVSLEKYAKLLSLDVLGYCAFIASQVVRILCLGT